MLHQTLENRAPVPGARGIRAGALLRHLLWNDPGDLASSRVWLSPFGDTG